MLSILIPVYNAICLPLVGKLYVQAVSLKVPFEIVLADDASRQEIRTQNQKITNWGECRYLQQEQNVGPSRIRNYLASEAKFQYLLFLDADTIPVNDSFLKNYLQNAQKATVVCGGFIYHRQNVSKNALLRYKYGILVEEQTTKQRSQNPYRNFIGMNFMICRDAFLKVSFDESLHFGYEDAYFGMHLEQKGVGIIHIDNPVYHLVEEDSEQYLAKIRRTVCNLVGHEVEMYKCVRLLRWYAVVKRFGMVSVVSHLFRWNEKRLVSNLTSQHPSLKFFALYKLGYLCTVLSARKGLRQ